MTTTVSFANVSAELAEPTGSGKAPALVLIQEWWGLNAHVKDLAERFAKDGFLVVAPDLYHGKTTKDADEAGKWMNELDTFAAVKEIELSVRYLKEHPRSNGNVGVVGFCMGGALSLASACHVSGLGAVVPFYGVPPAEKVDYTKVTAPVLMHVGVRDYWVTPEKAEAVKAAIGDKMKLEFYEADHAFVNDTRPEVYDAASAKLAWERTVAFFMKHLG